MIAKIFNSLSERYDKWFESDSGRMIYTAELECVRKLLPGDLSDWIEVGVGTGRFASPLGIPAGVDPSEPMLQKARDRGIRTQQATAEKLPYYDSSLQGILMVVTLCFLDAPANAMQEFNRVLKSDGKLLVGMVPADSSWGRLYAEKKANGHPIYSNAHFYSSRNVIQLATSAGFAFVDAKSTLCVKPGKKVQSISVLDGIIDNCGFVCMFFKKE